MNMLNPNADRDPNMMPTQSAFMRYVSPHPILKTYQKPANAAPLKKLEDLSGDGKVTQKDVLIGRGVIDKDGAALTRKNKFCGGMSKPYSRKK